MITTTSVTADASLLTLNEGDPHDVVVVVCDDFTPGTRVEVRVDGELHPRSAVVVERACPSLIGISPILWPNLETDMTVPVKLVSLEAPDTPGQITFDVELEGVA